MKINKNIKLIEKSIKDPTQGLPENIFLLISRLTPLINVDLLIKNNKNQTLLTWRKAGEVYKPGWHVPGGIVRYKEKIFDRILKVARKELKCKITFNKTPLAINEVMLKQINRGHFISLLYSCKLINNPDINLHFTKGQPKVGEWSWHNNCPINLIPPHKIYKKFM